MRTGDPAFLPVSRQPTEPAIGWFEGNKFPMFAVPPAFYCQMFAPLLASCHRAPETTHPAHQPGRSMGVSEA
jgi:hypothetical protein